MHSGPNVLVAHPSAPFNNFQEFLAYGRANPGKLNYGYTPAASGHMAVAQESMARSVANGIAPVWRFTSFPPRNTMLVGIPRM